MPVRTLIWEYPMTVGTIGPGGGYWFGIGPSDALRRSGVSMTAFGQRPGFGGTFVTRIENVNATQVVTNQGDIQFEDVHFGASLINNGQDAFSFLQITVAIVGQVDTHGADEPSSFDRLTLYHDINGTIAGVIAASAGAPPPHLDLGRPLQRIELDMPEFAPLDLGPDLLHARLDGLRSAKRVEAGKLV